jgi:dTDP-4-amino-4,6-dideoxygalactose transaminase
VLPPRVAGSDATYWLYSLLVPDAARRDALLQGLADDGIEARALWRPLHEQPPYATADVLGGNVAEALFARGVSLPCSTQLTHDEQARVIDAVLGHVS